MRQIAADRLRRVFSVLSVALLASALAGAASSQCTVTELQKLTASDGATDDEYGRATALSGNVAVIGAWFDKDVGQNSGSCYVYRYSGTWVEEQKLTASDGSQYDYFGSSVAVDQNVIVVGAFRANGEVGAAYVFRHDGTDWVEEQRLVASDGDYGDSFGWSVAVDGDLLVVGAYLVEDSAIHVGAAYVFRHDGSGWGEEQKLMASDRLTEARFGNAVAANDDLIVVGAYHDDDQGPDSGSAYVFRHNGSRWLEEQKLSAASGEADDFFGRDVSVDGEVILIGVPGDDDVADDAGSVFVFGRTAGRWVMQQRLTASDPSSGSFFGLSVRLSGTTAVVGALGGDGVGSITGAAYVFQGDGRGWTEDLKLAASDGAAGDRLGYSVSVSGDLVVAGAYHADSPGADAGAAYVFPARSSLKLKATPTEIPPGAMLRISTFYGDPGEIVGLAVIAVNGKPSFHFQQIAQFGINHKWDLTYFVAPGLSGLQVDLQSFGFNKCGTLMASNAVRLTFL